MKKYILIAMACAGLFSACNNELEKGDYEYPFDSTKLAIVKTGDVLTDYGISMKIEMQVESNNGLDTVMQQGVVVSETENIDLINGIVTPAASRKIEKQTLTVEGLTSGKTYYYCAYAQNQDGVAYGEKKQITMGKPWERAAVLLADFQTPAFLNMVMSAQFGEDDGVEPANFGALPIINGAPFALVMWSLDNNTGDLLNTDDVIFIEADFTDGASPEFTYLPYSFAAKPLQEKDIYFDSYEVIVSEEPFETVEQANAAKVYFSETLTAETVNTMHTVKLPDFENKVCYIGIRHKTEESGYALMISHLEASALFAPIGE